MLDFGLLATGVAIWLVLAAAARWAPSSVVERGELLDRLALPAVAGLLAGRLVAALLDDPASVRSVRAFLVIRGGVEFWPGVLVAVGLLAGSIRRRKRDIAFDLADLAPFLLWGYAAYEGTCLVRDGCYGPASAIGLVPDGLSTTMFPIGLAAAAGVAAVGLVVRQLWAWKPLSRIALAVGGVAAVRSVASIWLPRLGDDLTRQHLESLAVLAAAVLAGAYLRVVHARHRRRSLEGVTPASADAWPEARAGEATP